jgi:hypothetical protein
MVEKGIARLKRRGIERRFTSKVLAESDGNLSKAADAPACIATR